MKFRLEHETVGFEYTVDPLTLMHSIAQVGNYLITGYREDVPQAYRILAQGVIRALLTYMQTKGIKLDIKKGEDPVEFLINELPILVNETGVFKDAVLTFRVSETNDSPTITDIQLQL